jgi:hypothetical protein
MRREHHTRFVGGDHSLDNDGDIDSIVAESLFVPVIDRTLSEK